MLHEDSLVLCDNHSMLLQPTTHYTFHVAAWTSVGMGDVKTTTIQSGIEPVLPSPPTRLGVSNIEAFSVVLQFTPGFDGNSSITKWIVQVTNNNNSNNTRNINRREKKVNKKKMKRKTRNDSIML